jgi:hypothetical protein
MFSQLDHEKKLTILPRGFRLWVRSDWGKIKKRMMAIK